MTRARTVPALSVALVRAWFVATAFAGAALLFVVEPMIGKLLLPALGGAPAVWGTCLVFFQTALLAGYAWAHAVSRLPPRAQPVAHAVLLAGALATLPLRAPEGAPPPDQAWPIAWLVSRLASTVGLAFVAVAATGPLVQRWFARDGRDPYFLFAASNAGSFVALLAYPLCVEPLLALGAQTHAWSRGFVGLIVLMTGCALVVWREGGGRRDAEIAEPPSSLRSLRPPRPPPDPKFHWLTLAAIPSAMLLGVTTFVTTDVAPVPLLWVVPLALYLASFVVPFSSRPIVSHDRALRAMPAAVLALAFTLVVGSDRLLWLVALLHFAAFFVLALACHGEVARLRPPPDRLTSFYLVVAAGGAIGGALVALVAPIAFPGVWEYPLAVIAACALRARMGGAREPESADFEDVAWAEENAGRAPPVRARVRKWTRAAGAPVVMFVAIAVASRVLAGTDDTWRFFVVAQIAAAACAVAWVWRARTHRFTAMVAAMLAAPWVAPIAGGTLYQGRSFFAVHRVLDDRAEHRHLYVQGTTIHGLQSTSPDRARVAGAYFHRSGPAGDVFARISARNVGLVGLGVASLASYAEAGTRFTFYEIDPAVARVAEDTRLFTFLRDARDRGARVDVVLGDARLRIAREPDGAFDLLVLDAYSSDVVPAHLLTREAFALWFAKLAPDGFVLMNLSNRYLDLGRVVAAIARDGGLAARERLDELGTEEDKRAAREDGKAPSRWIVVARTPARIDALDLGPAWTPADARGLRAWSDDYTNVAGVMRF